MGELHLDIIIDRLRREFGVEINEGAPQVNYKEAITGTVQHRELFKKQTGGRGKFVPTTEEEIAALAMTAASMFPSM